jgi:hypothetical protein
MWFAQGPSPFVQGGGTDKILRMTKGCEKCSRFVHFEKTRIEIRANESRFFLPIMLGN